jgi:hypothetical protein
MAEVVNYEGVTGLAAIVKAIDNVRSLLVASETDSTQVASYLGCINLHLAELAGIGGDLREHLEDCGGLLCPSCKTYVGFVSDLSGTCPRCGKPLLSTVE